MSEREKKTREKNMGGDRAGTRDVEVSRDDEWRGTNSSRARRRRGHRKTRERERQTWKAEDETYAKQE